MKKASLIIWILFAIIQHGYAQIELIRKLCAIDFQADTARSDISPQEKRFFRKDSPFQKFPEILERNSIIELTINSHASGWNMGEILRIRNIDSKSWEAVLYKYNRTKSRIILDDKDEIDWRKSEIKTRFKRKKLNLTNGTWKNLWDSLIHFNLFVLPDEDEVWNRISQMASDLPDSNDFKQRSQRIVLDGSLYTVTIKVANKVRIYHYCNPVTYHEILPEIQEFQHFSSILKTLRHAFGNSF